MWTDILYGFQVATAPMNLLFCFLGVFLGTLMGVLPGIGPAGAMAILLPISLQITPVGSIIMLAGIYYGSMYGGSTTSILVSIPGEPASVMTCIDGHQMALKGKAGPALGIAAFASFIAGTFSVVGLMLLAVPLATAALKFGPPEFFSLVLMGLTLATYLSQKSPQKAFMSALIGLLLSWVGIDLVNGTSRFTFGLLELSDGVGVIPLVMGLFGISEVFLELEKNDAAYPDQDEDHESVAEPGRMEAKRRADRPGIGIGILFGNPSGRRRDHRKFHVLHHGEAPFQAPRAVRNGRDRRCGGTGSGQ